MKMGVRFIPFCLNSSIKNFQRSTWGYPCCQKMHSICMRKEIDFECRLSRISLYSSESPKKCWQCNFPYKSELFCQKCKTLQEPPESLDYFEILGIKKDYDIESKDMQRKYRQLQNILHPDRFGNRTEKEKQYSENLSSLINKAYATLTHPLERGLYLLKLKNLSIPDGTTNLDQEFLMEIMEKNEEVQEASGDKEKIMHMIKENNSVLERLSNEVSEAFHADEFEKAKLKLVKMKYYASLDDRLKKIKQDLGIVD